MTTSVIFHGLHWLPVCRRIQVLSQNNVAALFAGCSASTGETAEFRIAGNLSVDDGHDGQDEQTNIAFDSLFTIILELRIHFITISISYVQLPF